MKVRQRLAPSIFGVHLWARVVTVALAVTILPMIPTARAQSFVTIHSFSGPDGAVPEAGLSMDRAGNLYGTTSEGGNTACTDGCGTVIKLTHKNDGWILTTLYSFSGPDGANPEARVIIGPDGNLYGTTVTGGAYGQGTVFKLTPPATICRAVSCPWSEEVLYSFQGVDDGEQPQNADLMFDSRGNIYGTTPYGGGTNCPFGCGIVFQLTPSSHGWTETVLHRFTNSVDGAIPYSGLVSDAAGNMYGTNYVGGVYEMRSAQNGWQVEIISGVSYPYGGVIFDSAGNLYGVNQQGGWVYELTPHEPTWTSNTLYNFDSYFGSLASLTFDQAGNLYGTLLGDGPEVFKLTPANGQWTVTGFSGSDGISPYGGVIVDANGNVYGTASAGGTGCDGYGCGLVFEITP